MSSWRLCVTLVVRHQETLHLSKCQFGDLQGCEETMITHFQLSDQLYVKAGVPPTDKVNLWLGVSSQLKFCSQSSLRFYCRSWKSSYILAPPHLTFSDSLSVPLSSATQNITSKLCICMTRISSISAVFCVKCECLIPDVPSKETKKKLGPIHTSRQRWHSVAVTLFQCQSWEKVMGLCTPSYTDAKKNVIRLNFPV